MGTRSNVKLQYRMGPHIYFYQHYDGYDLDDSVARALDRGRSRWSDESYLARIIFSEMVKDDIDGTTGYGISPYVGDGDIAVTIDFNRQTANGVPFEEFIKRPWHRDQQPKPALTPPAERAMIMVESDSKPGNFYKVSTLSDGTITCTCISGMIRKYCKHQRKAVKV